MYIISSEYLRCGDKIKAVVRTKKKGFSAKLKVRDKEYNDCFNIEEPYDVKTHVFFIPACEIKEGDVVTLSLIRHKRLKFVSEYKITYTAGFADEKALLESYDSRIIPHKTETEKVCDGVTYNHYECTDKNSAPVHIFTIEAETDKATLYVGTPDDGYENVNVKAKVPEMIDSAVRNGVNVVGAMNADFFDMFGDCHPSGLCVKNGRVVANENSPRPFIGIKKDGTPVITDTVETPGIVSELYQAAAGLEMIVKDGKIFDWGPLEPFSFVRHPRTAAGVTKDGKVILLEVDGRIPEYSNGASLVDLANWMIKLGADRAINLDGGGSSIVYTKNGDSFELRNNPADLVRPRAKLIRKEFDALLVVKK